MRIDGASGVYAMLGNRTVSTAGKATAQTLTSSHTQNTSSSSASFDFTSMTPNQMKGRGRCTF
ncbi:hypothetical protein [Bradyrhizobium prioriisuperbiae]|uniref:hypothetical protein n=1 Tax=Bradyrhizobium prioriisuperbiae TaxID=2854389 RepID=UPI0028ECCEAE|nr:hypothetical protein [Bradyrhizobium prioritasuperba]